jgi:hypothetical protein
MLQEGLLLFQSKSPTKKEFTDYSSDESFGTIKKYTSLN